MKTKLRHWILFYFFAILVTIMYTVNLLAHSLQQKRKLQHIFIEKEATSDYYQDDGDSTTVVDVEYFQNITECACSRKYFLPPASPTPQLLKFNSSCSDEGTHYKTNQNVISISLHNLQNHGSINQFSRLNKNYVEAVTRNLEAMRQFYPGYGLRIYTNISLVLGSASCTLLCENNDLFWCDVRVTPIHGDVSEMAQAIWGILALGDPTVDVSLFRDWDSLISARESNAVKDWLRHGDKGISLMRDNKLEHDVAILPGLWQVRNNKLGIDIAADMRKRIFDLSRNGRERSTIHMAKTILKQAIFMKARNDIVAYDSYNCLKWAEYTLVRPFPTQRLDPTMDFVGNKIDFDTDSGRKIKWSDECPEACRPRYGSYWYYC